MGVLEFIASLVSSLAWPVAIVTAVVVFRRQLGDLLKDAVEGEIGLSGFKWRKASATVQQNVAKAQSEADAKTPPGTGLPGEGDPPPVERKPWSVEMYERYQAHTLPHLAIEGAYYDLTQRLEAILGDDLTFDSNADLGELAKRAQAGNHISNSTFDSIAGLVVLRDLAQSRPERVTTAEANEYRSLVNSLLYVLKDS